VHNSLIALMLFVWWWKGHWSPLCCWQYHC